MSDLEETVTTVTGRPYIAVLRAGVWCYVYSGYNQAAVLTRARATEFAMIGAGLDTETTQVDPAALADVLGKVIKAIGWDNIELLAYPTSYRCLVCGLDLGGSTGVPLLVEGGGVPTDGYPQLCPRHSELSYCREPTRETYLRLREIDEGRPYPPASGDEPEPMTRARQLGHDPVFDGVRGQRWTCRRCHRAVLEEGAQVYGSAIEAPCIRVGSLQWRP